MELVSVAVPCTSRTSYFGTALGPSCQASYPVIGRTFIGVETVPLNSLTIDKSSV